MKVFIFLSVVAVAFASPQCGENQHYNSCGTACPLTCKNYDNPPVACVLMCNPGCHCDEGYVKTEDGRCVEPKDCPARTEEVCGENQRYETCGTACPLTCDNYRNPPKFCTYQCVIGCQCEKGFVKTSDGRCVTPEECPAHAPVQKTCLEKPETGMCKALFRMWYYDADSKKCLPFVYGGCGGNGNRYGTEEECLGLCGGVLNESSVNGCDLLPETGNCRMYVPRYYFDKATRQCRQFIYGGCGGNENNYRTKEHCHQACA